MNRFRGLVLGVVGVMILSACSGDDASDGSDQANPIVPGADGSTLPTGDAGSEAPVGPTGPVKGSGPTAACQQDPNKIGMTTRSGGGRKYAAYAPKSYTGATPVPLVIGLHGAQGTGAGFIQMEWIANAESRGFIVIGPQGSGAGGGWSNADAKQILAAIDDVEACYNIDQKKRIVHGFSAGGAMSYFVGIKYANKFAGVAVSQNGFTSAEYLNGGPGLLPAPWKVPVSHFQGTNDPDMPLRIVEEGNKKLQAANHPFHWHPFPGGHEMNPSQALTMYNELITSSAP